MTQVRLTLAHGDKWKCTAIMSRADAEALAYECKKRGLKADIEPLVHAVAERAYTLQGVDNAEFIGTTTENPLPKSAGPTLGDVADGVYGSWGF